MREPTVGSCKKESSAYLQLVKVIPTSWNHEIPDKYDMLFVKVVDTDKFFVLKSAWVLTINHGKSLHVGGKDIQDEREYESINPYEVYYLPRPPYLDK